MANPQLENGYYKIANEIADAFCRIRIPGEVWQVLHVILRKTYGFGKKEDEISLSQFSEITGMIKPHVFRALRKAIKMNLITKKGNGYHIRYSFNKNYEDWKPLPKKVTLPKKVMPVTNNGNKPLPKKIPTKDNKDTYTKNNNRRKKKKEDNDMGEHTDFIKWFTDTYKSQFGFKYDFKSAKDAALVKRMLKNFGMERLKKMAQAMFDDNGEWICSTDKGLGILSNQSNKYALKVEGKSVDPNGIGKHSGKSGVGNW